MKVSKNYKHVAFSWGCYDRLSPEEKKYHPRRSRCWYFVLPLIKSTITPSTKGSMSFFFIILNAYFHSHTNNISILSINRSIFQQFNKQINRTTNYNSHIKVEMLLVYRFFYSLDCLLLVRIIIYVKSKNDNHASCVHMDWRSRLRCSKWVIIV